MQKLPHCLISGSSLLFSVVTPLSVPCQNNRGSPEEGKKERKGVCGLECESQLHLLWTVNSRINLQLMWALTELSNVVQSENQRAAQLNRSNLASQCSHIPRRCWALLHWKCLSRRWMAFYQGCFRRWFPVMAELWTRRPLEHLPTLQFYVSVIHHPCPGDFNEIVFSFPLLSHQIIKKTIPSFPCPDSAKKQRVRKQVTDDCREPSFWKALSETD